MVTRLIARATHGVTAIALMVVAICMPGKVLGGQALQVASYLSTHGQGQLVAQGRGKKMYDTIYRAMGVDYELVRHPYLRSVQMAAQGKIDAVLVFETEFGMLKVKDHPKQLVMTPEAQSSAPIVLVALTERGLKVDSLDDVKLLKLGMTRTFPHAGTFFKNLDVEYRMYDEYENMIRSLKAGRIDVVLISRYIYKSLAERYGFDRFSEIVFTAGCSYTYMGYSALSLGQERAQQMADQHAGALREIKRTQPELLIQQC